MLLTFPSFRIVIQGSTEKIDGLLFSSAYTGNLERYLKWKRSFGKRGEATATTPTISMAKAAEGDRYPPIYTRATTHIDTS